MMSLIRFFLATPSRLMSMASCGTFNLDSLRHAFCQSNNFDNACGYKGLWHRERLYHALKVSGPGTGLCESDLSKVGAGDRIRTGDIDLGKVALYQLSYSRVRGGKDLKGQTHCRARYQESQIAPEAGSASI